MQHTRLALRSLLGVGAFAAVAFLAHPAHAATVNETNSDTGQGSVNSSTATVDQSTNVYVCNDAELYNKVVTVANTGNNSASGANAAITTGNVTTSSNVSNDVNSTDVTTGPNGSGSSVTLANTGTGQGSVNDNSASVDESTSVHVSNDADVNNKVVTLANTGDNEIGSERYTLESEQTDEGDASITTGDITVNVTIDTAANTVTIHVPGANGGFTIMLTNANTGEGSVNTNTVDADGTTTIGIHNDADVYNKVVVIANTGYNTCLAEGNCTINTGDINVSVMIHNIVNAVTIALATPTPTPGQGSGPGDTQNPGQGGGVVLASASGVGSGGLGSGALAPTGANSLLLALLLALIAVLGVIAARRIRESSVRTE